MAHPGPPLESPLVTFAEYFNRQNLMLITPPNDQATAYGTF